jgi:ribose 5-phosphate isomerase B
VVVAADDQGRSLKTTLVHYLKQNGFEVLDQGIASDYVAAADVVAEALSQRRCRWGVVLDGAGVTSAAAANRNRDVAAAACWDGLSAKLARQRLDANILCLGANLITSDQAKEIAKKFLCT